MRYIYYLFIGCLILLLSSSNAQAQRRDKECPAYIGVKHSGGGSLVGSVFGSNSNRSGEWTDGLKLRIEVGAGKSGRDMDFDITTFMGNVTLAYDVNSWFSAGVGGGIFHDDANTGLAFLNARFYAMPTSYRIRPYADVKAGFGFSQSTRGYDDKYKNYNPIGESGYIYNGGYVAEEGETVVNGEVNGMTYKQYEGVFEAETAHQGPMCLLALGMELRNGFFFGATYSLITGEHKATTRRVWQFEDNTTYVGEPVTTNAVVPSNGLLVHVGWSILLKRKE